MLVDHEIVILMRSVEKTTQEIENNIRKENELKRVQQEKHKIINENFFLFYPRFY